MRTQMIRKAALLAATAFLFACPFIASTAAPLQSALPVSTLASGTSVKLSSNTLASVGHNASKAAETPAPSAAPAKQHDKKAVGRCWKRLMDMMREVRQAHHKK